MESKKNWNCYLRILNLNKIEGYQLGIKTKHCCQLMEKFVDDPRVEIYYYPSDRGYYIITSSGSLQLICNCPFCGKTLPRNLIDEREKVIKKELKIDPYDLEQEKLIPEEFNSDKWWKKRGL